MDSWEEDFRKRERILKKMCEYPYVLEHKSRYLSNEGGFHDRSTLDALNISSPSSGLPRVSITSNDYKSAFNTSFVKSTGA